MNQIFVEISLIIILAAAMSIIMQLLRQPLIIGYLLTGIISGPLVLDIVHGNETVDVFAGFGISLLLFIVGLGLNPKTIKSVGRAAVATGIGQIAVTVAGGWLLLWGLGYSHKVSLVLAVALAFSSTIIVLKIVSDKKEQNRLYGQVAIGFLLVQDIVAALLLIVAAASQTQFSWASLAESTIKGLILISGLWLMATQVLPRLRLFLAQSAEFLFLLTLAWGFGVGYLFYKAGLSLEVGALAAGIALASQPYAVGIGVRLRTLRDFFIIMFFVMIGAHIEINGILGQIPEALLLSGFVLVVNPLVVMIIMKYLGFAQRTAFKSGLAVSQISEFSLIFIAGWAFIDSRTINLITLIALITITISSYMMVYSDAIYDRLEKYMRWFKPQYRRQTRALTQPRLLLIGYNKGGDQFIKAFSKLQKPCLVIDYNPQILDHLAQTHIPHIGGDASDLELFDEIIFDRIEMVVITLSDIKTNLAVVGRLATDNPNAVIICSADSPAVARKLYEAGASYVMLPHYIGNQKILSFITRSGIRRQAFDKFRHRELKNLSDWDHFPTPKATGPATDSLL